ncbi:hypothetical protein H6504_02390 [Candidatus Woesearchaeota archaeon]|nr:hypothetical protein [Candidatus Woesearchaeota archaeon]
MDEHLVRSDQLRCYKCGADLSALSWESEFIGPRHYKSTVCTCGKEISMQVDFWSSGHDSWSNWEDSLPKQNRETSHMRTLENLVELAKEIKK